MKSYRRELRYPAFAVARTDARSLVAQVVAALEGAILNGFYATGSLLPPMRGMCKVFGVSMIVMNAAVAELVKRGLVNPRRGVGCVVLAQGERLWKGRVLFVVPESDGCYPVNILIGVVRETLMNAGWAFSQITLGRDAKGRDNVARLDLALRGSTNLVVSMWDRPEIVGKLSVLGVPYVVVSARRRLPRGALGSIRHDVKLFVGDFVRACVTAGIRRVEQVNFMKSERDTVSALRRAGIDAVETVIPNDADPPDSPESVRRAAMRAFSARLADGVGRARLPDLLYFADDIVASGALPALLYHGVHIPQDVKVVTIANRGNEPVLPISLARVSFDPFAAGRTIAAAVLSWLETGRFPKDVSFEDSFVPGESFPGGTSGEGSR